MVLCISVVLQAQTCKTIANLTAGGLKLKMTSSELNTVTKLTLSGTMDARDFKTINQDMPALAEIDLTNIIIAEYTGNDVEDYYETITYPANTIPKWSLAGKKSLTSIALPISITSIGTSAFDGCINLTSFNLPPSLTKIEERAFHACGLTSITIPSSVTSVGDGVFDNCQNMTSVNLPTSIISIGNCAFAACINLPSINLPSSVTTIGESAFEGCTGLTSVNIPNSVTTIEFEAFYYCTSLESINIPASVTSIGYFAFFKCTDLITVDPENFYYSSLDGVLFNKDKTELIQCPVYKMDNYTIPSSVKTINKGAFLDCKFLTSVTIPNSVITIGESAFYNCIGLISITIPNSVTTIENYSFYNCIGLTSVTIPNSVVMIGNQAFFCCFNLTSVNIPASVTSIGDYAFANCKQLTSIYAYPSIPIALLSNSFVFDSDIKNTCNLNVPAGSLDLYKSANVWRDFSKIGIITSTGKEFKNEAITVSPNPAKDVITVNARKGIVSIYNSNGKLEITQSLEENKQVNISSLPSGMYVVVVNGESFKMIKE